MLFSLNDPLNNSYISYGLTGRSNFIQQGDVDKMNYGMNKSAAAKRVAVKGKKELYNNTAWDLVDAADRDSLFVARVDMKTLPDSLGNKNRAELARIVKKKNGQRGNVKAGLLRVATGQEHSLMFPTVRSVKTVN